MRPYVADEKAVYVRDRDGCKKAGLSIGTFRRLADEFGCVYHIGKTRLTRWDEFEKGMENYKA